MKKIKLTREQFALVDDEDFEYLNQFKWQVTINQSNPEKFYATRSYLKGNKWVFIGMHREIMECPKGKLVDHLDGNPLNNQKYNLRICIQRENLRNRTKTKFNTSGYKGVYKNGKKWLSRIGADGVSYCLGTFETKELAAIAYDTKAIELHGEFANTNFPKENYKNGNSN